MLQCSLNMFILYKPGLFKLILQLLQLLLAILEYLRKRKSTSN